MINAIQYILGIIIGVCFVLGLIPALYYVVFPILIFVIVLQIIISFCRFRFLNVAIESFILFLALLSAIPFLGVVFRIFGLIISMLDLNAYKNDHLFRENIQVRTFTRSDKRKREKVKPKVKKSEKKYKNAKFSEK